MNRNSQLFGLLLLAFLARTFLLATSTVCLGDESPRARTALDDYVALEDDAYSWKTVAHNNSDRMHTFVLDMTSQDWRTADEVDRTRWQHWVTVCVPREIRSNIGFMWIGGGRNGRQPPKGPSERIQRIARETQTVVAEIHMIPNQPLVFHNDGRPRVEDDLIAYTWVKFLETGDPTWPARNPMVKSVVRAMDAVTELVKSETAGNQTVDEYVVAGGSKRGWTTWLVGAVDPRVVAIAPIVIDILNLEESVKHHFSAYGFFAPSIGDYVEHGIIRMTDHPRASELYALVDPYHYRHRLAMPKFVLNAAGDQFFPPDMSRYYFDDLPGEKLLRYVPNADHSLGRSDAIESLIAFYWLVLHGKELPSFSWTQTQENTLEISTGDRAKNVTLWQAHNPKARDFRMESIGPKYTSRVLDGQGDGRYVAKVAIPKVGWTAFFVEATFDIDAPTELKATTSVAIVPDVLPFANKDQTLPTSLTIRCRAPNEETAEQIEAALESPPMASLAEDPRLNLENRNPGDSVALHINWVPKGRFATSARAIAGHLEKLGCDNLAFQIESGRPEARDD